MYCAIYHPKTELLAETTTVLGEPIAIATANGWL
jgi:hypothetical protein